MRHQSVNQKDFGVQKKTRNRCKGTRMDRISKLCLEGNTERSESNPGYRQEESGCLVDSTNL